MTGERTLVVVGGVHGDEPSGVLALAQIARAGIAVHGPCNPWGLAHARRTLEDGRDLNRAFADARCVEAERVRAYLRARPPALLLDLHEDRSAQRPYVIQYGPGSPVGQRLVERLAARHAFEPWPRFGPVTGRDGLIRPGRALVALVGWSRQWPLVYWAWRTLACVGLVIEVPGTWEIQRRIDFHAQAANEARDLV